MRTPWPMEQENITVTDVHPGGAVELDRDMQYPGRGMPLRPEDTMSNLQPFARLTRGQPLGKKEILAYVDTVIGGQQSMTTILDAGGREGSDLDACQMCVTLSQPRVINKALATGGIGNFNQQNMSGSYDNADFGTTDFPGTTDPISWVPITAIVEWGLGGTRQRAFVDFVQGTVINLSASWVRVHAAVAPDAANLDFQNDDEDIVRASTSAYYEIAAFLGPGWTKPGTAQRTVFIGQIESQLEGNVFAVPPYARRATVISLDKKASGAGPFTPPSLTAAYLRFWQSPTGVTMGRNVGNYFQSGNQPIAFDVPNAGAYFSVQSAMDATYPFAVIFELSI